MNIYEYDFDAPAGERVVRVSGGDATVSDPMAQVKGMVARSDDGSHVYFVAGGVLTATPNEVRQVARQGADNLYVFDTETGQTAFISTLSEEDRHLWGQHVPEHSDIAGSGADVTPDGDFLVFTSYTDLMPDDTSTAQQVFEYDAQTAGLVRVSIGQNGYNDDGNTYSTLQNASIVSPSWGIGRTPVCVLGSPERLRGWVVCVLSEVLMR